MRNAFLLTCLITFATPLAAQTMDHSAHQMNASDSAATIAFKEANDQMHADMGATYTGDADVDFVANMIPHHQGAVDMAQIILEHGTDPEVRTFAEQIIAAQEAEIAWMRDWLARNGR